MKKSIFIISLFTSISTFLLITGFAFGSDDDWVTSGGNTYVSNGNVGIGTSSPSRKLDVNAASDGWTAQFQNDNGYIRFGPANTGGAHIYTDRNRFYFNKDIVLVGDPSVLSAYSNSNLRLATNSGNSIRMTILASNGYVGIGTTSPAYLLHLKSSYATQLFIEGDSTGYNNAAVVLKANNNTNVRALGIYHFDNGGQNEWFAGRPYGGSDKFIIARKTSTAVHDPSAAQLTNSLFTLNSAGKVGIGTTTPDYKLDVKGTIRAEEVKVETGWSDYVFEKDYNLRSLDEVEKHIKQNKHLPDIPSAKDIEKDGLNMAEIVAKQMQKIEELTLYVIQLKKENDELKSRMTKLEK